jgi:para-nitrobenzyl esterase
MAKSLSIESGALEAPEPDASGIRTYRGVPYAAPPLGALRWRPPQPVAAWTGLRPAGAFGPSSLQGVVWRDIDLNRAGVSEDCLYLNVWTPAAPGDGQRLPTMVWIHGGSFVVGSGAEPRYDGTRLAARGVVVVTLNHRLNALGFLVHPELTAQSDHRASGNYGMLDLVEALAWVKRNIAAFGGDPDKVTIAGESAGSEAACALMASPRAKGLFRAVIGESGAMFASPSRAPLRSRRPRPPASTSCARSVRLRWPNCAPPPHKRSSPLRRGSASVRSSTDGFCRARPPRFSPPAISTTHR